MVLRVLGVAPKVSEKGVVLKVGENAALKFSCGVKCRENLEKKTVNECTGAPFVVLHCTKVSKANRKKETAFSMSLRNFLLVTLTWAR